MRVLIVGAGAIGGYFGAKLAQAGRDVTFLVRAARAGQLRTGGLQIAGHGEDATVRPQLLSAGEIAGSYDVVLLAVKSFALDAAIADMAPAVGSGTMIVPLLNGMRHLDLLAEAFGPRPVLGGLCVISSTLDERGRIVLLTPSHDLTYGELDGSDSERVRTLDGLLQNAGFNPRSSQHVIADMWQKWVMLATLGGINCLMRGTVGEVVAAPAGVEFARAFTAEVAAVATANGYPPSAEFMARFEGTMTASGSVMVSSMYRDLCAGNDVEADQIVGDLLVRGHAAGVATPLLGAAYASLKIYQNGRAQAPASRS